MISYIEWLKQCRKNWLNVRGTDAIVPANPPVYGKDLERIDKIIEKLDREIAKNEHRDPDKA